MDSRERGTSRPAQGPSRGPEPLRVGAPDPRSPGHLAHGAFTRQATSAAHATTASLSPGGSVATLPRPRAAFGMPNLRRNVCPHFFLTGARGALPIQAPHLLKALIHQSTMVSRCQLRGGVHLSEDYVNDVCMSARFNQCVFYEDELTRRP